MSEDMNKLRPVGIIGTGKYVPEKILTNQDLEEDGGYER